MASLPEEAFLSGGGKIKKKITSKIYRYGIFVVICIEMLSILLKHLDLYSVKMYFILTQLVCALLIFNNNYSKKPKALCTRKKIGYNFLFGYYILGVFSLLTPVTYGIYSDIIGYGLLFVSFILIFLSLRDE